MMDASDLFWVAGEVVSAVALLAGVFLTLSPVETIFRWFGLERELTAGRSGCPSYSGCHATCNHWRYLECHPPCNHRLFLEAEW